MPKVMQTRFSGFLPTSDKNGSGQSYSLFLSELLSKEDNPASV